MTERKALHGHGIPEIFRFPCSLCTLSEISLQTMLQNTTWQPPTDPCGQECFSFLFKPWILHHPMFAPIFISWLTKQGHIISSARLQVQQGSFPPAINCTNQIIATKYFAIKQWNSRNAFYKHRNMLSIYIRFVFLFDRMDTRQPFYRCLVNQMSKTGQPLQCNKYADKLHLLHIDLLGGGEPVYSLMLLQGEVVQFWMHNLVYSYISICQPVQYYIP